MTSTAPQSTTPPVRRQARGERRIEMILDAADKLLGEDGYAGFNTNAVAARAGISPGSLYRFFRNKEAILAALADRYAEVYSAALDRAFPSTAADLTPTEAAGRMVDALVGVKLEHPALNAVFHDLDPSPEIAAALAPLAQGIQVRAEALVTAMAPGLPPARVRIVAMVGGRMFQSLSRLVLDAPDRQRLAMKAEVKLAMAAYMEHVWAEARDVDAGSD